MPYVFFIASKIILALQYLVIAWALMSWFHPNPRNPIVRLIHGIVDPVIKPIAAIVPLIGGVDLSPLVALLLLELIEFIFRNAAIGASLR